MKSLRVGVGVEQSELLLLIGRGPFGGLAGLATRNGMLGTRGCREFYVV